MNICGFAVIGQVTTPMGTYPLVDIPMMSPERERRLAEECAVKNYIRENGHEPESAETALQWQREWLTSKRNLEA